MTKLTEYTFIGAEDYDAAHVPNDGNCLFSSIAIQLAMYKE